MGQPDVARNAQAKRWSGLVIVYVHPMYLYDIPFANKPSGRARTRGPKADLSAWGLGPAYHTFLFIKYRPFPEVQLVFDHIVCGR